MLRKAYPYKTSIRLDASKPWLSVERSGTFGGTFGGVLAMDAIGDLFEDPTRLTNELSVAIMVGPDPVQHPFPSLYDAVYPEEEHFEPRSHRVSAHSEGLQTSSSIGWGLVKVVRLC